ncbi:O-antigen ligase [Colwellia sp. MB3u-55]|jgi:putative inorganic carbon (HCO3(-)) transporter|uniref:O-antigen ligase family protein n=1 Tax=Colwellia sp. MB3u-55 TaxID=2759810 RepID=UPI0015F65ACF|nr:O-antigen ligase family protein [Colwellia sp. MB3u-55]MBA6252583.1 O-antigen ligase family protein [Colwellia sp. MB3u-55]
MSALIASLFTILVFIRPQDWWSPLEGIPVVMVVGMLGAIFAVTKKNVITNHHTMLLFTLCLIGFISEVFNFYFVGAIAALTKLLFSTALPFIVILGLAFTRKSKEFIFATIIFAAVAIVYNGYQQVTLPSGIGWSGAEILDQHGDLRIKFVGIFSDPNDVGLLFLMTIPLIFYFRETQNWLVRQISVLSLVAIFYGIYLTNSRGTLLGVLVLIVLYLYKRYGKIVANVLVISAIPVLLLVFSGFRSISASEESAHGRLDAWYAGSQMLKSNPLFGTGLGGFLDNHHLTAHNTYVLCWSELGVVGFLVWFSFLFSIIFMLHKISFSELQFSKEKLNVKKGITEFEFNRYLLMSKVMFYSLCGYAIGVVFLSRLTFVPLYMFCAVSVGLMQQMNLFIDKPIKFTGQLFKKLCLIAFCVLIGINLSLKFLL